MTEDVVVNSWSKARLLEAWDPVVQAQAVRWTAEGAKLDTEPVSG